MVKAKKARKKKKQNQNYTLEAKWANDSSIMNSLLKGFLGAPMRP
jgi:hypothetical protein